MEIKKTDKALEVISRIGSFKRISNSIGEITFNGTHDATVAEARDLSLKMNSLMSNQPYYLINNLKHDLGSFPPEVWHFLGTDKDHNNSILGSVVITDSIGYKLQIKFFFSKFKPKYPFTIVSSKNKAYQWIENLKTTKHN